MKKHHTALYTMLICLLCFNAHLHAQSLALSFDDGLNPAFNAQASTINASILRQLKDQHIKSIVFPSLIKIGDYQGKQLIRDWGISGHLIGNHSALHQNLNKENVSAKGLYKKH